MANKFSDYVSSSNNTYTNNTANNNEQLQKMIDKYSTYSPDQLMSEFMRLSAMKKRDGTLNVSEINRIRDTIFPYLNSEQQQMFYKLMDDVK